MKIHTKRGDGVMIAIALVTALIGSSCVEPPAPAPDKGDTGHAEHPEEGPRGGALIMMGDHEFHVEVVVDKETGNVSLYTLDAGAVDAITVANQEASLNMMVEGSPQQFAFVAASQEEDPAGKTSRFELADQQLVAALKTEAVDTAELRLTKDGKQYFGKFELHGDHGHSHGHGGHDDEIDETLVWHLSDIELGGCTIQLGQHGLVVRAGAELEPAVTITRDGDAVEGAQVYATLVADDEQTILTEETLAVFEAASEEEPAHYAQNNLRVPADAEKVIIRYRIELPDGAGSGTYEVALNTEAAE